MRCLGILGSTRGTNMVTLINAIAQKKLNAKINVVISNKSDAGILTHARDSQLPAEFICTKNLERSAYDQKISNLLTYYAVEWVVLIGYMRILSDSFVAQWHNKIINVHPSLLPAFKGEMDEKLHHLVLNSGINETGCTVHYVTTVLDEGPILLQKKCIVLKTDTVKSLKSRVQNLEGEALIEVINQL